MMKDEQAVEEEKGFNAATDSLVPEGTPGPFDKVEDGGESITIEEKETSPDVDEKKVEEEKEEAITEEVKKFLGDLSEEEVIAKLGQIDTVGSDIYERVSQRVFGKFGEIGLDEAMHEALTADLAAAFSSQQLDTEAVMTSLREAVVAEMIPRNERSILDAFVPNAQQISQTQEFADWFFNKAPQKTREVFANWDNGTSMSGAGMVQGFHQYADFVTAETTSAAAKTKSLKRSVEDPKGGKAPVARAAMSEEEAFLARMKETKR